MVKYRREQSSVKKYQGFRPTETESGKKSQTHRKTAVTDEKGSRIVSLAQGSFESNRKVREGVASIHIPNLGTYKGEIKNYKAEGEGQFRSENGSVYQGAWKNDRPNGKGKEEGSDGSVYEGLFLEGRKHGKGKIEFKDGSLYVGDFRMGEMHGLVSLKNINIISLFFKYLGCVYLA